MSKTATEKALIQKILDNEHLSIDDKLDILINAGIPLGAEYHLVLKVTADEKSTKWMDEIGNFLLGSDNVVSFDVESLTEKELGDDEWHKKKWNPPKKAVLKFPNRMFVTTGQTGSPAYSSTKRPINMHVTDDGYNTLCGRNIPSKWKQAPYDVKMKTQWDGKKAKVCSQCQVTLDMQAHPSPDTVYTV